MPNHCLDIAKTETLYLGEIFFVIHQPFPTFMAKDYSIQQQQIDEVGTTLTGNFVKGKSVVITYVTQVTDIHELIYMNL